MHPQQALSVLVVDDEAAIVRTLSTLLRLEGFRCLTAASADEALKRLEEEDIHLVITDLVMPGADGLELVREAQERGHLAEFIVITAFSTVERLLEAYRLGIGDYLIKPFEDLNQVVEAIRRAEYRFRRWGQALAVTVKRLVEA